MSAIFDWLGREGGALLSWWALSALAGVAVYPLLFRLARGLPSRGYALARIAGLMLIGYLYWILNILGLLHNDGGNAAFAAILIFIIGVVSYATWREREPILPWLREHLNLIVVTELVFAAMFIGWALVRATNPDLTGTEKPMEMAFLSATRRSASFPPNDPWMSGYAISYYHFGYIMMATLANLSGVTNGIAFNLSASLLFALTCTGAYSVGYDLVAARFAERQPDPEVRVPRWPPFAVGILAAVMIAIMGNLGAAAVELPYQTKALPAAYFQFMDIEARDGNASDCLQSGQFPPSCFWWWFRWSRVVRDRDMSGQPIGTQPIEEFPQFSFVLSDIHPHVLSLPFVMLAIGLMLNLVLAKRRAHPWEFLIYTICIGGMVFLNSWDAVFMGLLIGAEALRRLIRNGTGGYTREDWIGIAAFGGLLVALTGLLYLPFFISFRSQAGGILPNLLWPTRFQQFFLIFGTFMVILATFVGAEVWRARGTFNRRLAAQVLLYGAGLLAVLLVISMISTWARPDARQAVFQVADEAGGIGPLIPAVLMRRLEGVLTEGFLLALIFGVIGRLFAREPTKKKHDGEIVGEVVRQVITYSPATGFVLLLIGAGAILALTPDFAYLNDNFGVRINTIFKLYYQTWAVWGLASAYAVWSLLSSLEVRIPAPARASFSVATTILIAAGLIYAPTAIYSRAVVDGGHTRDSGIALTLDGAPSLASGPDDYAVITCLNNLVRGDTAVLAEAMIDPMAYNKEYGRVSVLTGVPTLMGWSNHEAQWRGSTYYTIKGTRIEDLTRLYNTLDWGEAQKVIKQYHINYVYVGPTEHNVYGAGGGLSKFDTLTPVCRSGNVAVYATDSMLTTAANPATGGS